MRPGKNKGTDNIKNKLSVDDVIAIFKSERSQIELSNKYRVSQSTISNIKTGKTWGWLTSNVE